MSKPRDAETARFIQEAKRHPGVSTKTLAARLGISVQRAAQLRWKYRPEIVKDPRVRERGPYTRRYSDALKLASAIKHLTDLGYTILHYRNGDLYAHKEAAEELFK